MTDTRITMIRERLSLALEPASLEILDESHLHAALPHQNLRDCALFSGTDSSMRPSGTLWRRIFMLRRLR
jgi:stress-induced morphogen